MAEMVYWITLACSGGHRVYIPADSRIPLYAPVGILD